MQWIGRRLLLWYWLIIGQRLSGNLWYNSVNERWFTALVCAPYQTEFIINELLQIWHNLPWNVTMYLTFLASMSMNMSSTNMTIYPVMDERAPAKPVSTHAHAHSKFCGILAASSPLKWQQLANIDIQNWILDLSVSRFGRSCTFTL